MQFAGIAWTADGYVVEVIDEAGRPLAPPESFGGGEISDLVAYLRELGGNSRRPAAIVVESTNGVLEGHLLAAGMDVYRADPPLLGEPAIFGSPAARSLAELARQNLGALAQLNIDEGFMRGRVSELQGGFELARPMITDLEQAGRCVSHGPRDRAQVALTFDDGPSPEFTHRVLDVLARYEVPATFFCIGLSANGLEQDVARIADQGHDLGNHTWSHPYLPDLSPSRLREQVGRTSDALARMTGEVPTLMRPPYGALTPEVLRWCSELDETIVMWDVDATDWAMPGPDAIARRVIDRSQPGSVVLLHDGGGDRSQTVQALPAIIEGCQERGLSFVTLPGLLT
jgi:peptidoglycan/xylan/chitin deacetylase (PgdA/CDA1 family)